MTFQGSAPRLHSASDYERFGEPLDLPLLGEGERFLVALDVDGTIMSEDGFVSPELKRVVALLRGDGHHVVLATGRPLVALLPVAAELGLVGTPLVAANGSATAVLREDGSFRLTDAVTFRPERALDVLLARMPSTFFAVEEVGVGYWVGADFPEGTIMGRQKVVDLAALEGVETTRICAVDAGEHAVRATPASVSATTAPADARAARRGRHRDPVAVLFIPCASLHVVRRGGDVPRRRREITL